jgi:hypothetical protein
MTKIAHIIHPVVVDKTSDLVIAQPITFETMRVAREFADKSESIDLYAVQYYDEERLPLPECFRRIPDLNRSIADMVRFKKRRKLALIKDILDNLYDHSKADYFIYTNVDISLQPYFYKTILKFIGQGYDAFIINRRTIPGEYSHVGELPLMYCELGEKHPGWDCFIFKRDLYTRFNLGTTCIGTDWIGRNMLTNLICLAKKFKVFTDLHLTFHIGDDLTWKSDQFDDYVKHNMQEAKNILTTFEQTHGPLKRNEKPGAFISKLEKFGII